MLSNMANSLISHKRISTTIAKAKALRVYVEPLITKSKTDSTHSRRMVFRYLKNKFAVAELFRDVAPKVADRPGGYTRIIRTGYRLGDNAEMCIIELVDFNEVLTKDTTPGKTRRRRKKSSDSPEVAAETKPEKKVVEEKIEVKVEDKNEEVPEVEVKVKEKEEKKPEPKKKPKTESKKEIKAEAKTEKKAEAKTEPKTDNKVKESKPKKDTDSEK
jgi:large subunit ribosomal protein L17